ncbi:MAG: M48 family metallopeptidase [Halanaerobiales bacterium]
MQSIIIGNTIVNYDIVRTNRKTLGIVIDPEKGVLVRSPENLSEDKIHKVVSDKSTWILEKLDKVAEIKDKPVPKEFMSGEKLSYLGRKYRIKVLSKIDRNLKNKLSKVKVKFYKGKFIIEIPDSLHDINEEERIEAIRDELIKWYRKHAKIKIQERVDKYKGKIGIEPNIVRVKKQEKRWGSCSSKGNININWKIIMAPMSIVDYIVVHELTHLRYNNHCKDFWKSVEAIIPDYKERQDWLRVNGRRLDF